MMERNEGRTIVVGATGFTGRLVAEELAAGDAAGRRVVLAGRDPSKVERLVADLGGSATGAHVDVKSRSSLAALIRRGDTVINCAGPFSELGEPVVARCVEVGAGYVDTTGEQPWMRAMREAYHDAAVRSRVPIVNGMAFEWALGDCAAALLAARLEGGLDALDVVYAWGGSAASRGTRRTSLRIIGTRAWELEDGRWRRRAAASGRRRFRFGSGKERRAVAFGAGEIVTVPRWSDVRTVRGWLVMGGRAALAARVFSPALPVLVPVLRPILERLATRPPDPTPEERADSRFTIRLEGTSPSGERAAVEVRGADPYGLTAAIAVAGAERARSPDRPAGVLAPSQLVDPLGFLGGLASRGVEVVPER